MVDKVKILLVGIATVLLLITTAGSCGADSDEYWPMFNRDLLNTGVADPALGGIAFPIELWSTTTDNQIGSGSPVVGDIDGDGKLDIVSVPYVVSTYYRADDPRVMVLYNRTLSR